MDKDIRQWLAPLARRWGLEETMERQAPVFVWSGVVGEELSKLARPLYVEGHTLHIAVASHVAAMELRLLEGKLLARLSQLVPESPVKTLRFHVLPQPAPPRRPEVEEPTAEDWEAAEEEIPADLPRELRVRLVRIAAWARARDRTILRAGGRRCPGCGVAHLGPGELCPSCSLVSGEQAD